MADDEADSEWAFETEGEETSPDADDESDEGEQWRYTLSDLPDASDTDEDEQSAVGGNVFGSLSSDTEVIEAGSPNLESTMFVLTGAVLALLFFLQFYLLMG